MTLAKPRVHFSLRLQVFLALALAGLCLMTALLAVLPRLVTARFDRQETQRMYADTSRVAQAVRSELESLSMFVINWSNWDDTYAYVVYPTRTYETSNLVPSTFESSKLNLMLFLNRRGEIVNATSYDLQSKKEMPADRLAHQLLQRTGRELIPASEQDHRQGIVMMPSGPWLFAARSILTSTGKGPSVGTMVLGRELTPSLLSDLKRDSTLSLAVLTAPPAQARQIARSPEKILIEPETASRIQGMTVMSDLSGRPNLLVKVGAGRTDHLNGLLTTRTIVLTVLAVVVLFTALSMGLVEVLMLSRLGRYQQQVQALQAGSPLTSRFQVAGHDELSDLGYALNGLLDQTEFHQRQLHHQAAYDELTGLPNRSEFKRVLATMIQRQEPFSVVLLDLDNFKAINDTLGHDVGDEVLQATAIRLAQAMPATGLLARLGGDEFAALLPNAGEGNAGKGTPTDTQAQALMNTLSLPVLTSAVDLQLWASAGISRWPGDALDAATLLKYADLAMYRAKATQSRLQAYHTQFSEQAQQRSSIERSLQGVLERGELWLAYQPVMNLTTGQPVGCEALLRWHSPLHGAVAPAVFVPIAEDRGLIQEIGLWVLREACTAAAGWLRIGRSLKVAVNVSAVQLRSAHFAENVAMILKETGLPPALLELEVTETAVMANLMEATWQLNQVRTLGVSVALDDFGTGYASLELVRELPLDKLKLDRSFVTGAETDLRRQVIVTAIIRLARDLDLQVVAEGVETLQQRDMLLALRCPMAQGYLYSRPVRQVDLLTFLQKASASPVFQPDL